MFGILKSIFGGGSSSSSASVAAVSELGDLESFVDYIVRSLVDEPSAVSVKSEEEGETTVIRITCRKEDIGKVVGKRGKTIMAIRSLVSGAAGRMQKRVNVEVVD